MRTKQAFKNAAASFLLQITLALSGILIPRFFIALYGSPVNGLVTSINQFITYMGLVEAGIGAAGTVALYRPLAEENREEISSIVSGAKSFYLRSGMIFAALVAALVLFYPYVIHNEIQDISFIRIMILVLSVNGLVDYFFLGKYRILLMADQRGYVISVIQIAGTVIMTAVSIWMIHLEFSSLLVKGVAAAIYLFRSAMVAVYVRLHYRDIRFDAEPDIGAFSQRWSALLHQVAAMVVNNTDVILLTLLLSQNKLVEVSVYGTYNLVAYALSGLMSSISNGITPSFGEVISKGESEILRRSFQSYEFIFFLVVFIAYTCMAVLLHPFIRLYSADFADSGMYVRWSLVALFTAGGVLQALRLPSLTMILAAGHYKQTQSRAVLEAVINLVVSIVLIFRWGICGVLVGTCASYLYRTADCMVYSAKRFVPGSLKLTIRRLIRNGAAAGVLIAAGIYFLPSVVSGWFAWLLSAVICAAVSGVVLVGVNFACEPGECSALVKRALEIVHR